MAYNEDFWRGIIFSGLISIVAFALAVSVFFYVRTREPAWDNRSRSSRLSVFNTGALLGTELFTVFGTTDITSDGQPVDDRNSPYIASGGAYVFTVRGTASDGIGGVGAYEASVLVHRDGGDVVLPISGGAPTSPTSVVITPVAGPLASPVVLSLVGTRLEITSPDAGVVHRLGVSVTGGIVE